MEFDNASLFIEIIQNYQQNEIDSDLPLLRLATSILTLYQQNDPHMI